MRDFDNSLLTMINAEESILCFLVSMEVSDSITHYYTTLDISILWESNLYVPTEMEIETLSYTADLSVDQVSMKFITVDLSLPAIALNNELRNRTVIINLGGWDGSTIVAEPLFRGVITEWDMNEKEMSLVVSNELILWNKRTLRRPDVLCQWGFKETECGYTGEETFCNKTYSQCSEYSNTDNYGGFRFIQTIEEKDIWWGRTTQKD